MIGGSIDKAKQTTHWKILRYLGIWRSRAGFFADKLSLVKLLGSGKSFKKLDDLSKLHISLRPLIF